MVQWLGLDTFTARSLVRELRSHQPGGMRPPHPTPKKDFFGCMTSILLEGTLGRGYMNEDCMDAPLP